MQWILYFEHVYWYTWLYALVYVDVSSANVIQNQQQIRNPAPCFPFISQNSVLELIKRCIYHSRHYYTEWYQFWYYQYAYTYTLTHTTKRTSWKSRLTVPYRTSQHRSLKIACKWQNDNQSTRSKKVFTVQSYELCSVRVMCICVCFCVGVLNINQ